MINLLSFMAYKFNSSFCSVHDRIQITVSISGAINDGMHTQGLLPLYILLAKPLSTVNMEVVLHSYFWLDFFV